MKRVLIILLLVLFIGCKEKQKGTVSVYTLSYMRGQVDYINKKTDESFFEEAREIILDKEKYDAYHYCSNVAYMFLKIHNKDLIPFTNYYIDYKIKSRRDSE